MNARNLIATPVAFTQQANNEQDEGVDLLEYWDIIVDNRWLIAIVTALSLSIGIAYAFLTRPVYESSLLIQVEESPGSSKNLFGDAGSFLDIKSPAAAEIEILRSRKVIGKAVDAANLYIDAKPRYLPIVGAWLARHAEGLSNPAFGGYVTGSEQLIVPSFQVPSKFHGKPFILTAVGSGRYTLFQSELARTLTGTVGSPLVASTPSGPISLLVSDLQAMPGAEFYVTRNSRLKTIQNLQERLQLVEKGRQSGVIEATLQSPDPHQLALILHQIGHEYVSQNVERKAAEAEKMLAFVDVQLPLLKEQLDQAEAAYSRFRNKNGTISLEEEAKAVLGEQVDLQSKLMEAQQKRVELLARFTSQHPAVKTLDDQISGWRRQIAELEARVRKMPAIQQDALRLNRDVKLNYQAYDNLRNNALQLQLMREGKVGNVRVIDDAPVAEAPVKPKRPIILTLTLLAGLLGGTVAGFARNAFFRAVRSPQEVEAHLGVSVYATIPLSRAQNELAQMAAERKPGVHLLAARLPDDPAVEALRSLRTALQFAMLEAPNNRVLITGGTPGVGKSFISANFAVILASAGKRVLLLDADLRKGRLNHYFGISRERGLSEVVVGSLTIQEAIRSGAVSNLHLMTTGVLPPNPAELTMSSAFGQILEQLSQLYDVVILDAPPILAAADTVAIAAHAGSILVVARAGVTQLGELHETTKRLAHAGKAVTGVLFNAMDFSRRHYGRYSYKYGGYRYREYSYSPDGA